MKRHPNKRITLTPERIDALRRERDRTGVGPQGLLRPLKAELPKGLNHAKVTHWLGGRVQTVEQGHFDFVVEAWARLPAAESVPVGQELRTELNALFEARGLTPDVLLRWDGDAPAGLTPGRLKAILSGVTQSIGQAELDYLRGLDGST